MLNWSWSEGGGVDGPASGQVARQGAETAAKDAPDPDPARRTEGRTVGLGRGGYWDRGQCV